MPFHIIQLHEPEQKKKAAREILESLTDWFGIPETREEYIEIDSLLPGLKVAFELILHHF